MHINIYSKKPMTYINTVYYIYISQCTVAIAQNDMLCRTNECALSYYKACVRQRKRKNNNGVCSFAFFSLLPPLHSLLIIKKLDFFFSSLMFSLFPVLSTFLSNASTYERKNNSTSDG